MNGGRKQSRSQLGCIETELRLESRKVAQGAYTLDFNLHAWHDANREQFEALVLEVLISRVLRA